MARSCPVGGGRGYGRGRGGFYSRGGSGFGRGVSPINIVLPSNPYAAMPGFPPVPMSSYPSASPSSSMMSAGIMAGQSMSNGSSFSGAGYNITQKDIEDLEKYRKKEEDDRKNKEKEEMAAGITKGLSGLYERVDLLAQMVATTSNNNNSSSNTGSPKKRKMDAIPIMNNNNTNYKNNNNNNSIVLEGKMDEEYEDDDDNQPKSLADGGKVILSQKDMEALEAECKRFTAPIKEADLSDAKKNLKAVLISNIDADFPSDIADEELRKKKIVELNDAMKGLGVDERLIFWKTKNYKARRALYVNVILKKLLIQSK